MKKIKQLLTILLFVSTCIQLNAATLTVTNTANSGAGSLRDQIAAAASGDSIVFDSSTDGIPIFLTSGQIEIDKDLIISGNGISNTIVDGNDASRIFNITTGNVTIQGLTIQNGKTFYIQFSIPDGAGIANSSTGIVNIDHCVFLSCFSSGDGGGIANVAGFASTMNITACTFDGNHANFSGGGIRTFGGTMNIEACTFTNNTAANYGGGIRKFLGFGTVKNTTFSGNTAGAAGGGLLGDMTLINCTVANNHAESFGGGGIPDPGSFLSMSNCIFYNNTAASAPDLSGSIESFGYNIIGNTSGILGGSGLAITDMVINPLLDSLANNGGPTKTIALLCGSPAIDAADSTTTGNDQRGVAMFGGRRDIGAYESEPLGATCSGTNVTCNGGANGTAAVTVTGGMPEAVAQYLWSNSATTSGISNLTSGTYTVTVTKGECSTSTTCSFTVTEPAPLVASVSGNLSFCAGSSITLNAGTFASYNWSTGATTQTISVSTAGTYTVTVTNASGCTGSTSATTTFNPNPTPTISGNNILCAGGSTTLNAGSYAGYLWSSGATTQTISATTGTYTVTVTNAAGCTASVSRTLTAPPALTVDAGPNKFVFRGYPDSLCTTLQSTISGGTPPLTRLWSTAGNSNLGSGSSLNVCGLTAPKIYYLTVTDANGCSKTDSARVCVFDVRCGSGNKKVTICHGTGSASNPFQTLCILPADAVFHFLNHPGEKLGACEMSRTCPFPIMPNRLDEMTEEEYDMSLTAYPNPFSGTTSIRFSLPENDFVSVKVFDVTGRLIEDVYKGETAAGEIYTIEFDGSRFTNGIYFLVMNTRSGVSQTRKLILDK